MDTWTANTQARTKATATRHGDEWTSSDLELVTAFADEANAELASLLGRTLFAIQSVKSNIRAGRPVGGGAPRVAKSDQPYRGWTCAMGEG